MMARSGQRILGMSQHNALQHKASIIVRVTILGIMVTHSSTTQLWVSYRLRLFPVLILGQNEAGVN